MRLDRSTWPAVQRYFATHDTVMLLFGSTEQHGTHNPLGTDTMAPQKLSELVETKLPDLLIAPALPFGSTSRFEEFPGTISLGDRILSEVVNKVCDDLRRHGARHFVFLNGHGGNSKVLMEAAVALSRKGCLAAQLDWWKMVRDFKPAWAGGHGGAQETSANLYIDPTTVDMDAIEDMNLVNDLGAEIPTIHFCTVKYKGVSVEVPRPTSYITNNGWIGPDHPRTASAQWGEEMLTAVANWMVDFIQAFAKAPLLTPESASIARSHESHIA